MPGGPQLRADGRVQLLAGPVIGGNDQRAFRPGGILLRDGSKAFLAVPDGANAALPAEQSDPFVEEKTRNGI